MDSTQDLRGKKFGLPKQIGDTMIDPWIVLGDFNTILSVNDRINGLPVYPSEIVDFQEGIAEAGLGQITRKGCSYSWSNNRDATDRIYSRIAWAFGNDNWFTKFSSLEAFYHVRECSDHSPILINTGGIPANSMLLYGLQIFSQDPYLKTEKGS